MIKIKNDRRQKAVNTLNLNIYPLKPKKKYIFYAFKNLDISKLIIPPKQYNLLLIETLLLLILSRFDMSIL